MSGNGKQTAGVRTVKSADRTLQLLEYLSSHTSGPTLREVSEQLDIPRASAYALLVTLQRRGWVEVVDSTYRLGIRSLRAGAAFLESDSMVTRTSDVMDMLSAELAETIHMARIDGGDILYLTTRPSPHSLASGIRAGRRLPAHQTALGKAILSQYEWETVDRLLPDELTAATEHTITDRAVLREELERTRQRGYAIDAEETALGLRCFAVAVPAQSPPTDAISASVPMVRLDETREGQIVQRLLQAADQLHR